MEIFNLDECPKCGGRGRVYRSLTADERDLIYFKTVCKEDRAKEFEYFFMCGLCHGCGRVAREIAVTYALDHEAAMELAR